MKDISTRDTQILINNFIHWLYKKTVEYFDEQVFSIAQRNQQIKQSPLFTFRFMGTTFKFENAEVRYPQGLDASLVDEMRGIVNRRKAIIDLEGAYARQAFVSACSTANYFSDLYLLLPEIVHPYLDSVRTGAVVVTENREPLPSKTVAAFQTKHKVNLDKIYHRATRNLLGLIK